MLREVLRYLRAKLLALAVELCTPPGGLLDELLEAPFGFSACGGNEVRALEGSFVEQGVVKILVVIAVDPVERRIEEESAYVCRDASVAAYACV